MKMDFYAFTQRGKKQMRYLIVILANIAFNIGNYFLWTWLAFLERSYKAIGGEWLMIIGLFIWGLYISKQILKKGEKNDT